MITESTKNLLDRIEKCSGQLFPEINRGDSFYAAFVSEEKGILAFSAQGNERILFYDYNQRKRYFSGMVDGVIRSVSFHPDLEIAAISTLGYGGYGQVFGQVYLLNYVTGKMQPVFSDALSPGVYSSAFKSENRLWLQFTDVEGKGLEAVIDLASLPVNSDLLRRSGKTIAPEKIIPEPSLEASAAILEKITVS